MSQMPENLFKAVSSAVLSIPLVCLIFFGGSMNVDALANPLAGRPWGFDDMLPYMSEKQLMYRSGTGKNGDKSLGIVIKPSDDSEEVLVPKEDMNLEDLISGE